MPEHKYTMKMNLNVLNHLGIKLYSNVPAVLSEAVANVSPLASRRPLFHKV